MNTESSTASVLRYGSFVGIVIIVIGLAAHLMDLAHGETIMIAGIAAIIFTPFGGMLVSFIALSLNRETRYAVSALALIAVTLAGMLFAFWLR